MSILRIKHHVWYDKHAHIFRHNGRIIRAQIKELVFDDHRIYFKVVFKDKDKEKNKHVGPVYIATLQVLWLNVDIVSDTELSDDDASFYVPPECDQLTEHFDIYSPNEKAKLTPSQVNALNSIKEEVLQILSLTNQTSII